MVCIQERGGGKQQGARVVEAHCFAQGSTSSLKHPFNSRSMSHCCPPLCLVFCLVPEQVLREAIAAESGSESDSN